MTTEERMASALKGKFYCIDPEGRVIDVNARRTPTVASVLADVDSWAITLSPKHKARMEPILKAVERQYGIPIALICGPLRYPHHVRARQAATFLASSYAYLTNAQIAAVIGYANPPGVIRAANAVANHFRKYEPELSRCIAELQRKSISDPQPAASPHPLAVAATGAVPQVASAPVAPISRVLP